MLCFNMDTDNGKFLKFALKVAKKASKFLIKNFKKDELLTKERGIAKEIATRYDKESDQLIIKMISKRFPKHNILTEESGMFDRKSEYTWIVDPLDGSSNFALGNPFFCVSIALMKNNELLLGVLDAPALKEVYCASVGKGAFLNGKRIKVSDVSELGKSYLLSCEGGEKTPERISKINFLLHSKAKDLRKLGSGALEAASVACGRAEAYITTNINEWDVSSAVLIVKEAGGRVSDFDGNEWQARKSDIVFSNGRFHQEILRIINGYDENH